MFILFLLFLPLITSKLLDVMIVDLGADSVKVSLLNYDASKFFEVVLDEQAKRKTPSFMSFVDNKRFFGSAAKNKLARHPDSVVRGVMRFLATNKTDFERENQSTQHGIHAMIDPQNVSSDERGFVTFQFGTNKEFLKVEELTAMFLEYCGELAHNHASDIVVKHVLLVMPDDVTPLQRQAARDAVIIAGFNFLGFIRDSRAVSLAYAVDHANAIGDADRKHVLFVDIGASGTRVTMSRFSKGSVNVLHSRADRRVSGMAFDETLLRALKSSAVGEYVASSRSHAASFALQLEKTKRVLSVNRESSLRISPTDHDDSEEIKIAITRRAFEEASIELLEILAQLINETIEQSGVVIDDLDFVEVVGGGTRIPIVKETIQKVTKKIPAHHVNGDEGILIGATYFAASVTHYRINVPAGLVANIGLDVNRNRPASDFNAIDAEWSAIDGASTRAMSKPELQASAAVLELWRQRERDLRLTIEAKNTLESFVYECKELLRRVASDNAQMNTDTNSDNDDGDDDGTIKPHNVFVDDIDGVNALVTQLEATIDWLDVEGADAGAVGAIEFRRRLQQLKEQRDHVFHEYDQHALRAKMFDQMTALANAHKDVPVAEKLLALVSTQRQLLSKRRAKLIELALQRLAGDFTARLPRLPSAAAHNETSADDGDALLLSLEALQDKYERAQRSIDKYRARQAAARHRAQYSQGYWDSFVRAMRGVWRKVSRHVSIARLAAFAVLAVVGQLAWHWLVVRRRRRGGGHRLGGGGVGSKAFRHWKAVRAEQQRQLESRTRKLD